MKRMFVFLTFAVLFFVIHIYGQWNPVPGLPQKEFTSFFIHGDTVYAGSGNVIYKSSNGVSSWASTNEISSDVDYISAILKVNNRLIVGTYNYGIFESNDNGNTWVPLNNGLTGNGSENIIAIVERGDSIYAGTDGSSIFVMSKNGNQWTPFNRNIPMNISGAVYSLHNFKDKLVSGSGANAQIYLNENGQTAWQEVQFGEFSQLGTSMLSIINHDDILFGIGSQGFHKSIDGGTNWEYQNPGLGYINNADFAIYNQMAYAILVKSGTYYYVFNNNDNSWQILESQQGILTYRFIIINDKIFAARPDGLYYRDLLPTSVGNKNDLLPQNFVLHQNYPNPFNPVTNIKFYIPHHSKVVLKIYDLLGNEIKTLLNDHRNPGHHEVAFNASGLSSGIYFYNIDAVTTDNKKSFTETKKLVLLK